MGCLKFFHRTTKNDPCLILIRLRHRSLLRQVSAYLRINFVEMRRALFREPRSQAVTFDPSDPFLGLKVARRGFLDPLSTFKSPAGETSLVVELSLINILTLEFLLLTRTGAREAAAERNDEKEFHASGGRVDLKNFPTSER
jgi:hypothetical protein